MASRRQFLAVSTVLVAASIGLLDTGRVWASSKEDRDRLSPIDVINMMKDGNERFRRGLRVNRDFLREQREGAAGQFPVAVILSCIDSRAPAELIMDLGIGDVFNVRVAGNVANPDILGSLEFACHVAGAKVALVLGHSSCGAIVGAIDGVELGQLTGPSVVSDPQWLKPHTRELAGQAMSPSSSESRVQTSNERSVSYARRAQFFASSNAKRPLRSPEQCTMSKPRPSHSCLRTRGRRGREETMSRHIRCKLMMGDRRAIEAL